MKLLVSFLILLSSTLSYAECALTDPNDLVFSSKNIIEAEFVKANLPTKGRKCTWNNREIFYEVKVIEVLKGDIKPSTYTLKYNINCYQKPTAQIFEVGTNVILQVDSVLGNNLKLRNTMCGLWGWNLDRKASIKQLLKDIELSKKQQ